MIGSYSVNKGDAWEQIDQVNKIGTPVMGVNENNVYNILNTNLQGNLITGGKYVNPSDVSYIGSNPGIIGTVASTPANNTFINYQVITQNSIEEGVYSVNPTYLYIAGGAGGAITFVLGKVGSSFDSYVSSLTPGNAFNPGMSPLLDGFFGCWDSVPVVLLGTTLAHTTRVDNSKQIYLETGSYFIVIVTKTGVNFGGGNTLVGFYEFNRIS